MRLGWIGFGFIAALAACAADHGTSDPIGGGGGPIRPGGGGGGPSARPDTPDSGGGDPSTPGDTGGGDKGPQSGGGNGGAGGDDNVCEEIFVRATPAIPDMLIVLDKSASMVWVGCDAADPITQLNLGCPNAPPPYDQAFDRWAPSVSALDRVTAQLQDRVSFGLMLFPDDPVGNKGCQPGYMAVEPALNNNQAIVSALSVETPDGGSTPIPGTLAEARAYLDRPLAPDETRAPAYVLLVTDGAPNCLADGSEPPLLPTQQFFDQALQDSYAAVDDLLAADIKTYVIGYDTRDVPELATALDGMAQRGGTGATAHTPVEDEQSLLAAIESITGDIVSCTYELEEPPGDPDYIRVTLDGADIPRGEDGWELRGDTTIEITGSRCQTLQDNNDHALEIKVECEPVKIQ